MTENEWLLSTNPKEMLHHLRWHIDARKLRLFATACCREIWSLLVDKRSRHAVETAEQFADGLVDATELDTAQKEATAVRQAVSRYDASDIASYQNWSAEWSAIQGAARAAMRAATRPTALEQWDIAWNAAWDTRTST